jgi:hypothetical protein
LIKSGDQKGREDLMRIKQHSGVQQPSAAHIPLSVPSPARGRACKI